VEHLIQFVYVEALALVGAVIGFWVIRDKKELERRRWEMFKSAAAGMFVAAIVYQWCVEKMDYSHTLGMMVAGGFAFGGTDAALAIYQKIVSSVKGSG
jgi:amino acid transporter